jgi:hypothetical protein
MMLTSITMRRMSPGHDAHLKHNDEDEGLDRSDVREDPVYRAEETDEPTIHQNPCTSAQSVQKWLLKGSHFCTKMTTF